MRAYPARSLLLAILFTLAICNFVEGAENVVEVRLLLTQEESKKMGCEKLLDGINVINVCTLPYLADRDIEAVDIIVSLHTNNPNRFILRLKFNENGRRRLYRLTKLYRARKVAIFINGKLLLVTPVLPAVFIGDKVVIEWSRTENELRSVAAALNKKTPDIIELYVEETGKYNERASDSWADTYAAVNKYFEEKREEWAQDRNLVEESAEQE